MASHFILLADDLKDNSTTGWERSVTLRKAAKYFSSKLKLDIKMVYIGDINQERKNLTPFDQKRIQSWQDKLQSTFRGGKSPLPRAEFILKMGSPAEMISELINTPPQPDLVIMGTRKRSTIRKLFLGSVSEEVIRHSQRPVMIFGPSAIGTSFNEGKGGKINLIVFTDLQKHSLRAEKYALYLAKKLNAAVTLCFSVGDQVMNLENSLYSTGYMPNNIGDIITEMQDEAVQTLRKKMKHFQKLGVSATERVLTREAPLSKIIAGEINKNYDLVVMGTHSRSQVLKAFVGSSTRSAILAAKAPVIVVPSL